MGWLFREKLVEAFGVKSNHHFFADHQRGCRAALVGVYEIFYGLWISADVTLFKFDPFLRKVAFGPRARRSTRLGEKNYAFCHVLLESPIWR